jgi:quinoprotein glucose dehydrogenase
MSPDDERGIAYVPTGSPVFDFYGADRVGDGLFGDSLLALDAQTGKRIWHFQGVHHDIWDRDFPSPPALVSVKRDGKRVDAVAQTTKQGFLFLFDRTTGKPLFPIVERPFPASPIPEEVTSPTQPVPLVPEPFSRQLLTEDLLTQRTPAAHAWAEKEFSTYLSAGQFVPTALDKQTVVFPCFLGGAEWGGPAVDPRRAVIFINATEWACVIALTENKPSRSPGERTYHNQCSVCHGDKRTGSPPTYPSLVEVEKRLSQTQIETTILQGKGRMPGFPNVQGDYLQKLVQFLETGGDPEVKVDGRKSRRCTKLSFRPCATDYDRTFGGNCLFEQMRHLSWRSSRGQVSRISRVDRHRPTPHDTTDPRSNPPWQRLNARFRHVDR